ncbi:hypothetical protein J6590_072948 [Homalodisca vitripennis]|nr:hypothetical protein J6590_072948 [Homalodisca vitripennis]
MEWPKCKVAKLIELYEQETVLWNIRNSSHKNSNTRTDALKRVADVMEKPIEEVEKKLHCIRSQYMREKTKIEKNLILLQNFEGEGMSSNVNVADDGIMSLDPGAVTSNNQLNIINNNEEAPDDPVKGTSNQPNTNRRYKQFLADMNARARERILPASERPNTDRPCNFFKNSSLPHNSTVTCIALTSSITPSLSVQDDSQPRRISYQTLSQGTKFNS